MADPKLVVCLVLAACAIMFAEALIFVITEEKDSENG